MKRIVWIFLVTLALVATPLSGNLAQAEEPLLAAEKMQRLSPRVSREALVLLDKAGEAKRAGDRKRAQSFTESAIRVAPRLGAAHAALAGLLFDSRKFAAAEREYRIAVSLIEESDQPRLNTSFWGSEQPSVAALSGDTYARWGLALVEVAKISKENGDTEKERMLLRRAKDAFQSALSRKPSSELRQKAREMLDRFKF